MILGLHVSTHLSHHQALKAQTHTENEQCIVYSLYHNIVLFLNILLQCLTDTFCPIYSSSCLHYHPSAV
jgi:hypothetical protein